MTSSTVPAAAIGSDYASWGRYPHAEPRSVVPFAWSGEPPAFDRLEGSFLPRGLGRSYGDVCLNDGGTLIDATPLDRFLAFDVERGVVRCGAGVTLADLLDVSLPRGWFPPVLPGTRWVTVGGAIANDIHGKNHHGAGTFGRFVTRFELLRSTGERLLCSTAENAGLFRATIGGLGLTGIVVWAELRLERAAGPWMDVERIRFRDLAEFLALSEEDSAHEYTVAWVDCLGGAGRAGRGIFLRGDHSRDPAPPSANGAASRPRLRIPLDAPAGLLNRRTAAAFNELYYRAAGRERARARFESFFFPLDGVGAWNRLYGRAGFVQYQCVVPEAGPDGPIRAVLDGIARSAEPSFLAVLKRFGHLASPGLLSFPCPGVTLALDFPMRGATTLRLLDELDAIVADAGGAVYPAKDARMSARSFRRFFPAADAFAAHLDPRFSSGFWRRVRPDGGDGANGGRP
jgi:FAD/FMN-containing dehydrogenase